MKYRIVFLTYKNILQPFKSCSPTPEVKYVRLLWEVDLWTVSHDDTKFSSRDESKILVSRPSTNRILNDIWRCSWMVRTTASMNYMQHNPIYVFWEVIPTMFTGAYFLLVIFLSQMGMKNLKSFQIWIVMMTESWMKDAKLKIMNGGTKLLGNQN